MAFSSKKKKKDEETRHFPGGPVVNSPPSNAGDARSTPGRATKPACHNYGAHAPQRQGKPARH